VSLRRARLGVGAEDGVRGLDEGQRRVAAGEPRSRRGERVGDALLAEWRTSIPEAESRLGSASRSALKKGWRWIGEMEEIARTFAAADLPPGFHEAAAEIYRRTPHEEPEGKAEDRVVAALLADR
jgi:hypothetical protein